MKTRLSLSGLLLLLFIGARSQDAQLPFNNQNLVGLNPSFAGSNGFIRNQSTFRDQWLGQFTNYYSITNTFDAYVKPLRAGLAVSYMHDNYSSGFIKTNMVSVAYAQHLSFFDKKLKIIPSVQGTYANKMLDDSRVFIFEPAVQINTPWPYYHYLITDRNYWDLGAGLLVNYKRFYIGANVSHITKPEIGMLSQEQLARKLTVHASYNAMLGEKTMLQIFGRYDRQSNFNYGQLSANLVLFNHLVIGTGILSSDAVIANIGYRNNYFSTLIGYEATFSKLAGNTAGAWTVGASFNLRNKTQRTVLTAFEAW